MKKNLLLILILISSNIFAAEVSGNVFLDNTSDASNCTITFTPISPSAVLGLTTSLANGSFTVIIPNGVYNIKYEKNGYQTHELLNLFINGIVTLDDVVLSSNNLIIVNGIVNGAWTNGNTYKVTGDIIVPSGQTLTIEEGVEIKFDGYYSLIVDGTLLANGSENNFIKFTSNKTSPTNTDWNQIVINSSTTSKIDYCIIEYGKIKNDNNIGILNINGNLIITNSIIRNSDQSAISVRNTANVTIQKNKIYNCAYGLSIFTNGDAIIENNEIFNNSLIGLNISQSSQSSIIKNNIIHDCKFYGVQSIISNIKIERNIIFNNGYGIYTAYGKPIIVNNTIMFNENGIGLYDNETFMITNPIINSNIITNNLNYGINSRGVNKPDSVSYNLFNNNGSGIGNLLPVGVGPIITVNKNNTPSDAYYNIFINPEFESTTPTDEAFCQLSINSPAIDSGDPLIENTGSIVDIGAKEFIKNLSTIKTTNPKLTSLKVFPNPTDDFISLETNENFTFDSIQFFDLNGKNIDSIKFHEPKSKYKWEIPNNINKGTYLYLIMNGKSIIGSGKFVKK